MSLRLENVTKQYGTFQLQCSIEIPEGRITGFVGPNGAGKSTTIKAILGLISYDSGEIFLDEKRQEKWSKQDREKFGVVLADSGFSGYFSIRDIVQIMKNMYPHFHEDIFWGYCKQFRLPTDKMIKEFSTGMKAKLHLLLAISHDAEVLILDEPTAGLDVIVREEMLDLLRDYMEEGNRSILISSHISSDLEGICDDLYMIQDGTIILHEDTDRLISSYGVLKLTEQQFNTIDKSHILKRKKDSFGYSCLTDEMQFYMENVPGIVIEKCSIDDVITLMIRGE